MSGRSHHISSLDSSRERKIRRTLFVAALIACLTTACSLLGQDHALTGRVVELQDDSALILASSTAGVHPGQPVRVFRIRLQRAVKRTARPWRIHEQTGAAVIEDLPGERLVRIRMTSGVISTDHDIELRR